MLRPEDIVTINTPTVDIYQPDWARDLRYSPNIIYSIHLATGAIVTSPEKFPSETGTDLVPAP
jgi:hypothetical protein